MVPPLPPLLPFLKQHWHSLALCGLVLLAFAAGRFSAPTSVKTSSTETTATHSSATAQQTVIQAQAKERIIYRDRTVITHADGSVERRDVERATNKVSDLDKVSDKTALDLTSATTKTASREVTRAAPRLHVNILAAESLEHLGAPAWGAQVEYRVGGPIWAGAFGLSSGVGGVSVGLEF